MLLDLVYILVKLGSNVVSAHMYKTVEAQNRLIAQYKSLGYDMHTMHQILKNFTNPSAFDVLCECCAGFLICGLFVGTFFAQEYTYGSMRQLVSRGVSRFKIYMGKLFVSWITVITFSLLNIIIYFSSISIIFEMGDIPNNFPIYILRYIVTIVLSGLVYASCAQLLATITKNIGGVIGFVAIINICGTGLVAGLDALFNSKFNFDYYWFVSTPFYMLDYSLSNISFAKYGLFLLICSCVFIMIGYNVYRKQEV